jgi:transcriptional regulator with XRE-family HTH domain
MSNLFSERLKGLRGDRNKAEFSRELGIPAPMYHRYEAGQIPKSHYLGVIADKCKVTVDWLLHGPPDKDVQPPIRTQYAARSALATLPPREWLKEVGEFADRFAARVSVPLTEEPLRLFLTKLEMEIYGIGMPEEIRALVERLLQIAAEARAEEKRKEKEK